MFAFASSVREYLKENKVGKNDVVTIELKNSKEFLGCVMACEMNGTAFVPAGVIYPELMKRFQIFSEQNVDFDKNFSSDLFEDVSVDDRECIE